MRKKLWYKQILAKAKDYVLYPPALKETLFPAGGATAQEDLRDAKEAIRIGTIAVQTADAAIHAAGGLPPLPVISDDDYEAFEKSQIEYFEAQRIAKDFSDPRSGAYAVKAARLLDKISELETKIFALFLKSRLTDIVEKADWRDKPKGALKIAFRYVEIVERYAFNFQIESYLERRQASGKKEDKFKSPTSTNYIAPMFDPVSRGLPEPDRKERKGEGELCYMVLKYDRKNQSDVQLSLSSLIPEEDAMQKGREVMKALKADGLKTLMATIRECHKVGNKPTFRLDMNRMLDAMGYKRDERNIHRSKNRKLVLNHINNFSHIQVEAQVYLPSKRKNEKTPVNIRGKLLTYTEISGKETESVIDGVYINFNPQLYDFVDRGLFTWHSEKLLKIDAQHHDLAFLLQVSFDNQWRIGWNAYNGVITAKLRRIMDMAGLMDNAPNRSDKLKIFLNRVIKEMDYLVEQGLVKSVQLKKEDNNPLESIYEITIPDDHGLKMNMKEFALADLKPFADRKMDENEEL